MMLIKETERRREGETERQRETKKHTHETLLYKSQSPQTMFQTLHCQRQCCQINYRVARLNNG